MSPTFARPQTYLGRKVHHISVPPPHEARPLSEEFIAARLVALRSLDATTISAYRLRWTGQSMNTKSMKDFWEAVHQARIRVPELTEEEREASREWLREHKCRLPGEGKSWLPRRKP